MHRISALVAVLVLTLAHGAVAAPPEKPQRTVEITGEGSASAMPDRATISAGVVSHGRTASIAMDGNRGVMNRVFDAVTALGIPRDAIATADFSLDPEYPVQDPKNPQPPEIIGYRVSNQVTVTLSDVSKAGAVLDALISAGANQSAGVSFSVKDTHPLAVAARANAARDALERAETYTREVHAVLGPVLSIRESGGRAAGYSSDVETVVVTGYRRPTDIAASAQTIEANVTVVWALK